MNEQAANHGSNGTNLRGYWLRLAHVACVAVALLAIVVFVISIPLRYAQLRVPCPIAPCDNGQLVTASIQTLRDQGISLDAWAIFTVAQNVVVTAVWCAVGIVIFWRKANDPKALFVALFLITFGVTQAGIITPLKVHPLWKFPANLVELIGSAALVLFLYLFPDGRFVPRWTRWLAIMVIVVWFLTTFPGTPFDLGTWPLPLVFGLFFVWFGSGLAAQIYRYRLVAGPIQRQQTKWIVFAIAVSIIVFLGLIAPLIFVPALEQPGSAYNLMIDPVITLSWIAIPIAIGIAILRYRLYDIDILINRTLVYGTLTASLVLVYIGSVVLLQQLLRPLAGSSELAVVVSTLTIATLFAPLRRRIQNLIDKRFYRRKYDAAKVLAAFGATARDETDLEQLTGELLRVVDETMQPEFVGLWLREPRRDTVTE